MYKTVKSTHKVGKKLNVDPGTVYYWVRDLIPENQKFHGVRQKANKRAVSLFKKNGPMTYKDTRHLFSDDLIKRLLEDSIINKVSKKYGLSIYSIYFIKGQEKDAKTKLENIIENQSVFYTRVSNNLPDMYTNQEKRIADVLKENNIEFDHSPFMDKVKLCPDFVIPSMENPKIFVDAKNTKTKARGNYTYMSKIMGFDALLIKNTFRNTVLVAVVNGLWLPSAEKRLKQAFDYVVFDDKLCQLVEICKKHLSG